ncbi:MAG: hypothetical protein RLZZ129_33, partial [Verrucomicrobiota bacterium]
MSAGLTVPSVQGQNASHGLG